MAEIEIVSSPSLVTGTFQNTVTTGSFSAPEESLLVAMVIGAFGSGAPSVSGGSLTWTRRVQRTSDDVYAEIWTAPAPSGATGITVTATQSGAFMLALKVDVVTGADLVNPAGQTGTGSITTNNATVTGYTSSKNGSRGFIAAAELNALGTPSSSDDEVAFSDVISGLMARKAGNTPTAGTAVTFNLDAAGSGSADWQWAALEILPGSVDAEATPGTTTATTTIPTPGISAGQTATPGTVTATAAIPAPSISTDQTATPGTVTATVTIPNVAVTTGSVTVVPMTTVTATASVSAPAISAGQTAAPATVAAAVSVPQTTVDAQRQTTILPPTVLATTQVPEPDISVPVLPGDLITGDGQIEWAGMVWGGTSLYRVVDLQGWDDLPDVDSGNVERPSGHGSYPGRKLAKERYIAAVVQVEDRTDGFPTSLQAILDATPLLEDESESPLAIRTRGQARWTSGAVVARLCPPDMYGAGIARVAIRWECSDPRLYSLARHGTTVLPNDPVQLLNAGNVSTQPVIRIPGPCEHPRLENDELERTLAFNIVIEEHSRLDIDIKAGTARIGSTSVVGQMTGSVPITDWVLGPGRNTIIFTASEGGSAGADILWYDAWI